MSKELMQIYKLILNYNWSISLYTRRMDGNIRVMLKPPYASDISEGHLYLLTSECIINLSHNPNRNY